MYLDELVYFVAIVVVALIVTKISERWDAAEEKDPCEHVCDSEEHEDRRE